MAWRMDRGAWIGGHGKDSQMHAMMPNAHCPNALITQILK